MIHDDVHAERAVMARLRASVPLLGPSERRVAEVVISRPADVVDWSTLELAAAAETSPATVVRACQNLGFRGFQHLRLEIARAVPGAPGARSARGDGVFAEAIDALQLGSASVEPSAVMDAVRGLAAARRIVLVGNGFSSPPLQDTAMRLSALGRSVEAPVDVLAQQFAVHSMSPGDVCLALSYSGANSSTLAAARAAADRGATVVLITSFARSPIARAADVVIATGPSNRAHGVDPFLSRLSHLVVLHQLITELARDEASDSTVAALRGVVADALADEA
ncbi:MurR/RpiR family transcriptional regulator [Labedella endophytica]|uniref:MurR/RpiR family transcriptional regulator n=1 Tax=Labedella endophytica TaxID=1523160 RepID=A0A433JPB3_9MICO|nr:MurR/RpiR family transcriptional regulator [Labedella endophytica]RUQ98208.1 MurR/RpiR family transcriptional regulator [Labedella endophytica]